VHQIGTFAYHFWMLDMKARRRNDGNQHLHRVSPKYRDHVKRKLHAYHVFIQTGLITHPQQGPEAMCGRFTQHYTLPDVRALKGQILSGRQLS
jgi:hypothetical protein